MAFDGKNKAQDLEEIIEQKVQEEVERRLNNFKDRSSQENQKLDRREFLKKAGMGAAGLAALGLSPAASEVIIDDNQGLRMANGDIDLNNQNITAVNRINGYEISDFLNSGGGGGGDGGSGGGGSKVITVKDSVNAGDFEEGVQEITFGPVDAVQVTVNVSYNGFVGLNKITAIFTDGSIQTLTDDWPHNAWSTEPEETYNIKATTAKLEAIKIEYDSGAGTDSWDTTLKILTS